MAAIATGTATATEQWPPGHEFDYAQSTATVTVSATTEATANVIVTGNAVTYDGSTVVMVEFFAPVVGDATVANAETDLWLYDGASSIGNIAQMKESTTAGRRSVAARFRLTPSNAAHTYGIRASISSGNSYFYNAAGGAATRMPAFIRITKV